ncbi:MAG: protein translocase subunit SecDF [Bacteroidetes bacterium]|nr:protein translocase subunit SecDF [Bacteroidota bacterium]MBX7130767.1 protein translocase subunit SecDF [Flavobacteriales bacterium]MCC6656072.1 protein translocase subunit SecDF [Flavobacteriales bacterium]HMU12722.1 protein translocase subunit SecDF [Flavobacteriales bacterium]HNI04024.1 protein translocase subunit SecDF [Flavobacteriales bacterium]
MQNRTALLVFTTLLTLACLYQLSFSFFSGGLEKKAVQEATFQADSVMALPGNGGLDHDSLVLAFENRYIREHQDEVVYPVFGYTYKQCKEREINQGLDLKGGMAVTLEVSIPELVENLGGHNQDAAFQQAIADAREAQKTSTDDFITLFDAAFKRIAPQASLAAIFSTQENANIFPRTSTNEQVIAALHEQANIALNNTEKILRTRIDKFGVSQPSIQKQTLSGRIQIELPGVKDKERVRKVLQSTANLEFWETFDRNEVFPKLGEANQRLSALLFPDFAKRDSVRADSINGFVAHIDSLKKQVEADSSLLADRRKGLIDSLSAVDSTFRAGIQADSLELRADDEKRSPLFGAGRIEPNQMQVNGSQHVDVLGYCRVIDTTKVNAMLRRVTVQSPDPSYGIRLAWSSKAERSTGANSIEFLTLRALKVPRDGKPRIDGRFIIDARQDFDPLKGDPVVGMDMNDDGARIWKQMTGENVGKAIAITLDDAVVSAPAPSEEIPNGSSRITLGTGDRNSQLEEAVDLANVLKAGALPAPARIIDETVVGPSLGAENIRDGLISFVVAMLIVMIFMVVYYNGGGWVANVALIANVFILMGTLASMQASLTLPGIAGIVLTVGMAVDANVLINERIREELRHGKAVKTAVDLGYKHAMSAIIDANVTHFASAVILYMFGTGPIKSFGTTLGLGILTSLFTAIFISRLIISRRLEKGKPISFWHDWNKNIFANANYDFMGRHRMFYAISAVVILAGVVSMFTRGFSQGVDFSGGRQYVVKFHEPVPVDDVKASLTKAFVTDDGVEAAVTAKTYGGGSQVMITTNFMVFDKDRRTDSIAEAKLRDGLSGMGGGSEVIASRKVDPTISDDIRSGAVWAVSLTLLFMFVYIAVRFRNWQFGIGAVLALVHDALIVLSLYSLLHGLLPFSLELDEHFIAAVLTVIGYSINDTVVVFDRIREYLQDHRREPWPTVFNKAINSTLGRTINTALTVLLVLLVIFLLGGVTIQGFVFAMLVGIAVGTYSSIFIASAVVVDLHKDGVAESVPQKPVTA